MGSSTGHDISNSNAIIKNQEQDTNLFRKFVFEHINTALNEGFNDNIGRTNVHPVFELPKASTWNRLFDSLVDFFLNKNKSPKIQLQYSQLKAHIDIESQFSENRCKKYFLQLSVLTKRAYQSITPNPITSKR